MEHTITDLDFLYFPRLRTPKTDMEREQKIPLEREIIIFLFQPLFFGVIFVTPLQAAILACFKVLGKRTITFFFRILEFGGCYLSRRDPKQRHWKKTTSATAACKLSRSDEIIDINTSSSNQPTKQTKQTIQQRITHSPHSFYFAIPSPYLFLELMRTCPFLTIMSCPWLKKEPNEPLETKKLHWTVDFLQGHRLDASYYAAGLTLGWSKIAPPKWESKALNEACKYIWNGYLGGGFKYLLFSTLLGERIQFD